MAPGNELINVEELNEIKKFLLKVMVFYLLGFDQRKKFLESGV